MDALTAANPVEQGIDQGKVATTLAAPDEVAPVVHGAELVAAAPAAHGVLATPADKLVGPPAGLEPVSTSLTPEAIPAAKGANGVIAAACFDPVTHPSDCTVAGEVGTPVARMRAAIAAAVCAFAFSVAPALAGEGDDLLPDLVTLRPTELSIHETSKHLQLRLSNTIANKGPAGPLEIYPGDPGFGGCDANEQPAFQRVFKDSADSGSSGHFVRGVDTEVASADKVGCMAFHPSHGHWHFQDFALYELRHEGNGKLAARALDASGTKVSFCVIDTFLAIDGLLGTPTESYYQGDACGCPPSGCGPEKAQGLSIGYADIYTAGLPGQRINIDRLPKGKYCLTSTADPVDRLVEANELNNDKRRRILLHPRKQELDRLHGPCRL